MRRFNVSDLSAIETRVGAWVAQCGSLLNVFENGLDPYIDFAVKMTGQPYQKIASDIKSKDQKTKAQAKRHRQMAKPAVLGAIYRMGGGEWGTDAKGDKYKSGLWGYAESMGVSMTQEEAHSVVKIFRESYPEICGNGYNSIKGIWVRIEDAIADVLNGKRIIRTLGPNDCIEISKLTIEDRKPILRIKLPSGRYLHYIDASIEVTKMPWQRKNDEGNLEDVYRPAFTYYSIDQDTHQWVPTTAHGGHTFENIVQAIARDILAECALRIDAIDMEICGHVHDEIIALTDDDPFAPGALEMQALMSEPMSWAPSLPLGAEAWEDYFYHK